MLVGVSWAVGAAVLGARAAGRPGRLFLVLPILAAVAGAGVLYPTWIRLLFVHVHNLGAVAAWVLLFRERRALVPLLLLTGALVLLLSGVVSPVWSKGLGVDIETVGRWLAPGLAPSAAVPLVLAHVFTDSVHYAFWLGVIPEETLAGEGSLTFRMTWRGLVRDFGFSGLAFVVGLMALLGAAALLDAGRARDAYFAVAGFHGYLEGAMIVYLISSATRAEKATVVRSAPSAPIA